jgi:hypothetical protein
MERLEGRILVALFMLTVGCGSAEPTGDEKLGTSRAAVAKKSDGFDVDFVGCSEFAGIGVIPAGNAQPFVPAGYTLAGDGSTALVVVRVAKCQSAVVDGKQVGETITSQVGVTLQGPDASADINNYTVFYATNQGRLHAAFRAAGVEADESQQLSLSLTGTALSAKSASPHSSSFQVAGSASVPTTEPTAFVASWWTNAKRGAVQSRTEFPSIRFGSSTTTLTTTVGSELAALLGGTSFTFAALDSYNTFQSAHLEVRRAD